MKCKTFFSSVELFSDSCFSLQVQVVVGIGLVGFGTNKNVKKNFQIESEYLRTRSADQSEGIDKFPKMETYWSY